MIIVKFKGGLGNQMFQYAAAKGQKNRNEKIFFDLSFLKTNIIASETFTPRILELNIFHNIKLNLVKEHINKLLYKKTMLFNVSRKIFSYFMIHITQVENEYCPIITQKKKITILEGYFQSEKYFKHIKNELVHDFSFPILDEKNEIIKKQILNSKNSVCIHVRRGDYLKPRVLNYMGIIPLSYYKKAIFILEKKLDNPTYFIFSDDPEYCIEKFYYLENKIFIDENSGENSWKDMALMTNCKHHIIANSSFSWWGAWLSNYNGLKYAPLNWFNPQIANYNIQDFIPSHWEIITYD